MAENSSNNGGYVPEAGFIPDSKTAIAVATAVWNAIYGEDQIVQQLPIHAALSEGVWFVKGSLPAGYRGGVAHARIDKRTGRILSVSHSK